jgi:GT2 family glycosyltransferase/glycosyltransferase involved in cell wall biosynthesis
MKSSKFFSMFRAAYSILKQYGLRILLQQSFGKIRHLLNLHFKFKKVSKPSYSYQEWIRDHEPGDGELNLQRQEWERFSYKPLVSFLTPVFNPKPEVLKETIESVLVQTYSNWEFCLANGSPENPEVRRVLDQFAKADPRIRVIHLQGNLGIANNTNQALHLAKGDFVALMDHDDLVSPDMLYQVVKALNNEPELDILYCDEDKVSENGKERLDPWFKPTAFSPDLLLSNNYLMHSVIRKKLIIDVGAFDPAVDGAQDWDLSLRCLERTDKIKHIPRVFYHWRQVKDSAASDANAKPWAFAAQKRCIKKHLERLGVNNPEITFPSLGVIRVLWPTFGNKVSIIIPNKDKPDLLKACINSILSHTTYPNYEIILVENGSTDLEIFAYYNELAKDKRVQLVTYPYPFNFHRINNFGVKHATGSIFLFLNNDTEILEPTWLNELVGWVERKEIGVVGAKLLHPDETIQHAGIVMGLQGHGSHIFNGCKENFYGFFGSTEWYRNYMAVTGACMTMRREVFDQMEGFDEDYIVGYGDIDICLRIMQSGYRIVYTPFARIRHHEGGTRGLSLPASDVIRASISMRKIVKDGDPFFNPNLSYSYLYPAVVQPDEENRINRLLRILRDFKMVKYRVDVDYSSSECIDPELDIKLPVKKFSSKSTKKLLLITHELSRTGAPIILQMLSKYLSQQGYEITVISPFAGLLQEDYTNIGIDTIIEPEVFDDARVVVKYFNDFDLVFANTILAWRVIHAAKAFGKPCLWWVHESNFGVELASRTPVVAEAFALPDQIVFPSQATADMYKPFQKKNNFNAVHSGIDLLIEKMKIDALPREEGKQYMVNVASVEHRKGQDILLKAIKLLPEDVSEHLISYFIGRPLNKKFHRKILNRASKMKNVHLVGELTNAEVWAYLKQADIFIMASRDEALPISLLEAMAIGKGIISTRAGGIAEVIEDGNNGFVVDVDDAKGLARAIGDLCTDGNLLSRFGENVRLTFKNELSSEAFGQNMLTIIRSILENTGTS